MADNLIIHYIVENLVIWAISIFYKTVVINLFLEVLDPLYIFSSKNNYSVLKDCKELLQNWFISKYYISAPK